MARRDGVRASQAGWNGGRAGEGEKRNVRGDMNRLVVSALLSFSSLQCMRLVGGVG